MAHGDDDLMMILTPGRSDVPRTGAALPQPACQVDISILCRCVDITPLPPPPPQEPGDLRVPAPGRVRRARVPGLGGRPRAGARAVRAGQAAPQHGGLHPLDTGDLHPPEYTEYIIQLIPWHRT